MKARWLCRRQDLGDGESKGFSLTDDVSTQEVFVVRRGDELYAFVNRCPHTGVELNWQPDRFLDIGQRYIQCSVHGALFRLEDGMCLRGPCVGQRLRRLRLLLHGEDVYLAGEAAQAPDEHGGQQ